MDSSGLPEVEAAADAVVPSVGPDVDSAIFQFPKLSGPLIIIGASVLMVWPLIILGLCVLVAWLKNAIQVFWRKEKPEELEFFDCNTFESKDLEPSKDLTG